MVLTGDVRRSEDIVADVLGRAFERWDHIAAVDSPFGYVRKMVSNEYLSLQRRHGLWLRWRSRLAGREQISDPTEEIDRREAMIDLLADLPARQRAVIVMRYYLDLSDRDIAEHLGCSPATVRSHTARALARLRVTATHDSSRALIPDEPH